MSAGSGVAWTRGESIPQGCNLSIVFVALFVALYTVANVKVVGQEVSPGRCVRLGTSRAACKRMKALRNSGTLGQCRANGGGASVSGRHG